MMTELTSTLRSGASPVIAALRGLPAPQEPMAQAGPGLQTPAPSNPQPAPTPITTPLTSEYTPPPEEEAFTTAFTAYQASKTT